MKITKRLQTIADMIDGATKIYDVGCDHAYLDLYLAKKGFACVAIDIRKNIIELVQENVINNGLQDKITVMLNNGLDDIVVEPTDVVILSGLGTKTILKITENHFAETIIVQSNDNLFLLRDTMIGRSYYISDEKIIYEDGKYYVIIKFERGIRNYSEYQLLLGPKLLESNSDIFVQYLNELCQHFKKVLSEIPDQYRSQKQDIERKINYIKMALK